MSGTALHGTALYCTLLAPVADLLVHGNSQALAQEVACYLGLDLSSIKIKRFADGEIYVQVQVRLREILPFSMPAVVAL